MLNQPTSRRIFGAVASILLLGSCGTGTDGAEAGAPALLKMVSAADQSGVTGQPLPERLAVRVLDGEGRPVSGARVYWELDPDAGSLERASSTTDRDGVAENTWQLGSQAGKQVGRVRLEGAPTLEFTAVAASGALINARVMPGHETLLVHQARRLEVALSDHHGNSVDPDEMALTWTITDPGVASVDDGGVVRALRPGRTEVRVSAESQVAEAVIEVRRLSAKGGNRVVSGTASLPAAADPSAGYVMTLLGGAVPLESHGFSVEVAADAATVILLMESDRIWGMTVVPAAPAGSMPAESEVDIDARSTAAALVYLTPPFGLAPPGVSHELLDVIHSLPETGALAEVIASEIDTEGRFPAPDDPEYRTALLEAYGALVAALGTRPFGEGASGPAGWAAPAPLHAGLEFSDLRLDRSGTDPTAGVSVRNHALRWVSLYRWPITGPADPADSAGDGGWLLIPAAAPCVFERGSLTHWFNRCWTGQAAGDPRGSHDLGLTLTPYRHREALSAYGPGSGGEAGALPPNAPEMLWLPTVMTYVEVVLGSVVVPLVGARVEERMLDGDTDTEALEYMTELVRWLGHQAEALPTLDRCIGDADGAVDGLCVKEELFQHAGDEGWSVLAEAGRRLAPSFAAQFTEEELRWLGWRENLTFIVGRTGGVLARISPEADRPLLQAMMSPARAELQVGYNELIGATAISIPHGDGQSRRAVYPGESLSEPPAVRVADQDGNPVAEAWVIWEVAAASGSVGGSAQLVTETDAEGIARVDWILGEGEEHQSLTAQLAGSEAALEFTASVFRWGQITTSGTHHCGLGLEGEAFCWGDGTGGRLGTGSERDEPGPRPVMGEPRFTQLATAPGHTCGLTEEGAAYCWGEGSLGRLGRGSEEAAAVPTPIMPGPRPFVQITANGSHACGLADDGRGYCWGRGENGQLGTGSWGSSYHELGPTLVEGGLRFSQLTTGSAHTCGLTRNGRAYCWGLDVWGRLGTISSESTDAPVPVTTDRIFTQIVSGSAHNCALTEDGEAFCWGYGWEGHLGTGRSGQGYQESVPAAVSGNLRFVQLAAGSYHTCGLTREGDAYCWGSGPSLGTGSPEDRAVPTPVHGSHRFVQLAAGVRMTCGVTAEGQAYCWGPGASTMGWDSGEAGQFEPVRVEPPRG
jgi:alpha-tubulin suppressor-like RCC1 family protein